MDGHGDKIDQQQSISSNGVTIVFNDPQGLLSGYADGNGDGIDDDINGNNIYGRNGEDLGVDDGAGGFTNPPFDGTIDAVAPTDLGDLLSWIITFGDLSATSHTEMSGLELMATRRYGLPQTGGYHDLYFGVRYVDLTDSFGISGTGGVYDSSNWDTTVENLIIGPQIGTRVVRQWHRFSLTGEARFLFGTNFQSARQVGKTATNGTAGGQNQPVNLFPTSFNDSHSETVFSPVAEWRVEASYFVARWLSLRCGYTGMYLGNVSRASSRMNYTLPDFGLVNNNENEGVFSNALTLGIEITR